MSTTAQVLKARHWSELGEPTTLVYHKLTKETHPDTNTDPKAVEAFQHLMVLWKERNTKPKLDVILSTRNGFEFQRTNSGEFLYTVSSKSDNDLLIRAENGYRLLEATSNPLFFPALAGKRHSPDGRAALQLDLPDGNWWLLSDFPTLGGRDIVWIAKRVLVALIIASEKTNMIHGDVNAANVLVNPAEHGVLLSGWGGQVKRGEKLIIKPYHTEALLDKKVGSGWLDRRATATMFEGFNLKEPALVKYFKYIKDTHVTTREALRLLEVAAQEAFGAPKFNKLEEPKSPQNLRKRF